MFHDIYAGSSLPTHRFSGSFTILLKPSASVTHQPRSRSPASCSCHRSYLRTTSVQVFILLPTSFLSSWFRMSGWGGALDQYTRSLLCPGTCTLLHPCILTYSTTTIILLIVVLSLAVNATISTSELCSLSPSIHPHFSRYTCLHSFCIVYHLRGL